MLAWRASQTNITYRFDVLVAPEKQEREDRLGEEVEDTVENSLRVGRNDVATFAKAPCNWIEYPDAKNPDGSVSRNLTMP